MATVFRSGLLLGLLVVAWTFVVGFTGWYKDPQMVKLFWLVIPIQITVLVLALRRTAAQGTPYLRQVQNGVALSVIAALIIFAGSYLFTSTVFPTYFQDLEATGRTLMARQGLSMAQIDAAVKANAPMQTSTMNALAGAIGTSVTGLVVSLLAAIWLRKK